MKEAILRLFRSSIRLVMRALPLRVRSNLLGELIRGAAATAGPADRLRLLLDLDNRLYSMQGAAAREYGGGIHTKHRHIRYHDFFLRHLHPGESLLDIGSGNGYLDYELVTGIPGLKVTGIELSEASVRFAREHFSHPNLRFIHGDALRGLPGERFEVVTLSNVLEHFEDRVGLLRDIVRELRPSRLILRVPVFERDWRVPLKKELGLDYRLDSTHFTEYTLESFAEEIEKAGLGIVHLEVRWGEIWSVLKVRT
jgi:SAM-dependent methyltransferase